MKSAAPLQERSERRKLRRVLLKQINEIVDPCSAAAGAAAGLVDFGLIRGLDLSRRGQGRWDVRVRLMLTEPACIMGGPFAVRIHERVILLPDVASVEVKIESVGDWTEASMSKKYARQLATARAQRVIPIAIRQAAAQP